MINPPKEIQLAIDKMAAHLATQRAQSRPDEAQKVETDCMYRDDNGRSCSIGCLFSDEAYKADDEPENLAIGQLLKTASCYPAISGELAAYRPAEISMEAFRAFMQNAQRYHDEKSSSGTMPTYIGALFYMKDRSDGDLEAMIKTDLRVLYYESLLEVKRPLLEIEVPAGHTVKLSGVEAK